MAPLPAAARVASCTPRQPSSHPGTTASSIYQQVLVNRNSPARSQSTDRPFGRTHHGHTKTSLHATTRHSTALNPIAERETPPQPPEITPTRPPHRWEYHISRQAPETLTVLRGLFCGWTHHGHRWGGRVVDEADGGARVGRQQRWSTSLGPRPQLRRDEDLRRLLLSPVRGTSRKQELICRTKQPLAAERQGRITPTIPRIPCGSGAPKRAMWRSGPASGTRATSGRR